MPKYFTHYWANKTCDHHKDVLKLEGKQLDHTAGSLFTDRGVNNDDTVYVITVRKGELFLIGKLQVKEVCNKTQAKKFIDYEPWDAPDHLIAKKCTPMRFDRSVSYTTSKSLEFESPKGTKSPVFVPGTKKLDQQTLRGVRELTAASAAQLDSLLEPMRKPKWQRK